jgi:hypothetical protein
MTSTASQQKNASAPQPAVMTLVMMAAGMTRMMRNSTASRFSSPGRNSTRTG